MPEASPFRTEHRYLDGTHMLETTFITASGRVRVTDLMTLNGAAAAHIKGDATLAHDEQRLLIGFGRQVCATCRQPDSGLWEAPGLRRH